tara:strand:+ start:136 stop:399 length:264 start_codon:yes stop_codon:yes gene_type:complete
MNPLVGSLRMEIRHKIMQTKKQSFIESLVNVTIAYLISLISLFIILPLLGVESTTGKNILITLYFTFLSIARSYVIRRYFTNKNKQT